MQRWVVLVLLLAAGCDGCESDRELPKPAGRLSSWPSIGEPLKLIVSDGLVRCEVAALKASIAWWSAATGRNVATLRLVRHDSAELSISPPGSVAVTHGRLSSPENVAETHLITRRDGKLHSAEIRIEGCGVWEVAHEMGHALGLGHSNAGLMKKEASHDWRIHSDDLRGL